MVKPTPVRDIDVGNVLTYQIRSGEAAVVSHRVLSRSVSTDGTTTFITKGDNNDSPDANPVTSAQVKGTVWYSVPLLGYVNNAVNGPGRRLQILRHRLPDLPRFGRRNSPRALLVEIEA